MNCIAGWRRCSAIMAITCAATLRPAWRVCSVNAFPNQVELEEPASEPELPPPADESRRTLLTSVMVFSLAAVAAVFLWLHLDTQKKWQQVSLQNSALLSAMDQQRLAAAEDTVGLRNFLDAERASLGRQYQEYLETLEWSVNQSGEYALDETPLGDERLEIIAGLLDRLRSSGFTGAVEVRVHAGDFCLVQDANGGWLAAEPMVPVPDCERVGWPSAEGFSQSPRESVAFANFRTELARLPAGINLRVEDMGNQDPRFTYPVNPQAATAQEWNRIAARNNRVQVRLLPEADQPALLSQELPQP